MNNNKNNKKKIQDIINKLENLKKKSYSSRELRSEDQMMSRLSRIQDKELVKRISLKQKEIKEKTFIPDYDLNKEDTDILDMFGIQKKKKVQKHRGGFWNFTR